MWTILHFVDKHRHLSTFVQNNQQTIIMSSKNNHLRTTTHIPELDNIYLAAQRLTGISVHTPLVQNLNFSEQFGANIYFKREDLQVVRSYKIRGAYNKMISLSNNKKAVG